MKLTHGLLAVILAVALMGCTAQAPRKPAPVVAPPSPPTADNDRQVQQLQKENAALTERAGKAEEALQQAQEELRWLHIQLEKHPAFDPPQSAAEAYLQAYIKRNGAAARIYLSEPMRAKLNMPAHGIGTSDWPFRRYEILSQTEVAKDRYQFKVRLCGEGPACEGKSQTFTIENKPGDTGNEVWLITDIHGD